MTTWIKTLNAIDGTPRPKCEEQAFYEYFADTPETPKLAGPSLVAALIELLRPRAVVR